jgi:hypothetical protein
LGGLYFWFVILVVLSVEVGEDGKRGEVDPLFFSPAKVRGGLRAEC